MPDYEDRIFGVPWLDDGKFTRKFVEENRTTIKLLTETFSAFQNTEEYKLIILAMKDWSHWIDGQWSGLDADTPGYLVKMGQLQAMRRYQSWFQKLIVLLKGLPEAPPEEEGKSESFENYV